jgi:hypothetical protein
MGWVMSVLSAVCLDVAWASRRERKGDRTTRAKR